MEPHHWWKLIFSNVHSAPRNGRSPLIVQMPKRSNNKRISTISNARCCSVSTFICSNQIHLTSIVKIGTSQLSECRIHMPLWILYFGGSTAFYTISTSTVPGRFRPFTRQNTLLVGLCESICLVPPYSWAGLSSGRWHFYDYDCIFYPLMGTLAGGNITT